MKRRFRLTSSADLERVRRSGRSYAHPLFVLIVLPNGLDRSRFAVAAGKSVGSAVQRNRAKRLLRAALTPFIPSILPGVDLLLIARRPLAGRGCQEAQEALLTLIKRAHLLVPPDVD